MPFSTTIKTLFRCFYRLKNVRAFTTYRIILNSRSSRTRISRCFKRGSFFRLLLQHRLELQGVEERKKEHGALQVQCTEEEGSDPQEQEGCVEKMPVLQAQIQRYKQGTQQQQQFNDTAPQEGTEVFIMRIVPFCTHDHPLVLLITRLEDVFFIAGAISGKPGIIPRKQQPGAIP